MLDFTLAFDQVFLTIASAGFSPKRLEIQIRNGKECGSEVETQKQLPLLIRMNEGIPRGNPWWKHGRFNGEKSTFGLSCFKIAQEKGADKLSSPVRNR